MVEFSKVSVNFSDRQLKELKNAVENKIGTTLRTSLKMFDGNDLTHELLLTARQKRSYEMHLITICQLM